MRTRKALLACSALAAMVPAHAWAQDEQVADRPSAGIQDIIVTARRTEESAQSVPVAITAFDSSQLEALDIQSFADMGKTVPNLDVQRQFGSASSPQYFLRGVATGTLSFEADAGIGLYVDGVYLGRPAGSAFDLAEVERVEVLRGPQGTLFGRNSTGGAINFITAKPTGEFGVKAEGTIGNFQRYRGKISVNLPALGPLTARIAYLHDENTGYVKNLTPGRTFNFAPPFGKLASADSFGAENTDAISVALRLDLGAFTADYKFDYLNKVSTQLGQQLLGFDPSFLAGVGNPPFYTAPPSVYQVPSTTRRSALPLDFTSPSELEIQGHSLTLNYELNEAVALKSITAYRKMDELVGLNDIDGGAYIVGGLPFCQICSIDDRHQSQWSQEVQILGKTGNLDWVLGAFYFTEKGRDNGPVFIGTLFPTFLPTIIPTDGTGAGNTINIFGVPSDYLAGNNIRVRNRSYAGYAHVAYKTDHFELAGGVRYTKDDRSETVLAKGLTPFVIAPATYTASSDHWDFDATATYIVNPNVRAYLRFATGYLSGGVIGGAPFKAETMRSYEAGLKADLLDRTLRVNAALFHSDRSNVQTLGFTAATGTFIYSSPSAQETGFELEILAKPNQNFTFNASYGYLDQKLGADPLLGSVNSLAPKHTLSIGAQYDSPHFSNDSYLTLRFDGFFKDKRLSDPLVSAATASLTTLPSRFDINARLSLVDVPLGGGKAKLSVWAQNLTNNQELEFARNLSTSVIGTFQVPRTFGVDLGFQF